MADVTHFVLKKKMLILCLTFFYAWINAESVKILEFVLIGSSDIGESLIYLIKYANYAN